MAATDDPPLMLIAAAGIQVLLPAGCQPVLQVMQVQPAEYAWHWAKLQAVQEPAGLSCQPGAHAEQLQPALKAWQPGTPHCDGTREQ